jgi:hypothetical protein
MRKKISVLLVLIALSMVLSSLTTTSVSAQTSQTCEQCGMVVDATSQAHFWVVDASGNSHYVECMMCALKLLSKYDALNITTTCDYNGPSSVITVNARQKGAVVTVNPPTALVIAGGGCAKNRVVSSPAAASALQSNNGTSAYLAAIQKYVNGFNGTIVTLPLNATVMSIAKAALQFGGGIPAPSPSIPPSQICESCGMTVAADTQAHFKIVDRNGITHYACCIKCAIKVLTRTENQLNITTNCDWYGINFPITISVKGDLNDAVVTPSTAMIIDGSCTKNRVAYDLTAVNALIANNGQSANLIASQNTTIPSNATVMSLLQAVKTFGVGSSPAPTPSASPSPYPSPTRSSEPSETPDSTARPSSTPQPTATARPSSTPEATERPETSSSPSSAATSSPRTSATLAPTANPLQTAAPVSTPSGAVATQTCEACGMDVTAESQTRYKVTDGNGNIHYVECFMCALNLINDHETLHIETFCDWNGPNYPITVDTSNFGATATVTPSTAVYLRGGSCVTARAAYDQAAADALLANGFSQYTSPEQQYALPSDTAVQTVKDAIAIIAQTSVSREVQNNQNTTFLTVTVAVGVAVIAVAVVAFKKFKRS